MMKTNWYLLAALLTGCTAQLQHGLDERAANEVVTALVANGFKAQKVPEPGKKPTWAVEVDDAHATAALRVLTELKLPRATRLTTQELTKSTSLIETPGAERLRQLEAQEGDLEVALEGMDGVTSAAIELVVPAPPRPGVASAPSKAAVLVQVRPDALERLQQQRGELRALVAAGVEGLHVDDVVLVLDPITLQPAPAEAQPADHLRALLVVLSLALSVAAGLVMLLAFRLRRVARAVPPERSVVVAVQPAPTPRPVVNPAVQRKVA
jgi:type III secretion protein J